MRVLCIDPGTTHLVACVFEVEKEGSVRKLWSRMFNVQHEFEKIARAAKLMFMVSKNLDCTTAVIEYQAPMGIQHTCRWNAFVEGGLSACLALQDMVVITGHPSAVKRKLGLSTGTYANNKKLAFIYASKECKDIESHHEADCYILAKWFQMFCFKPV